MEWSYNKEFKLLPGVKIVYGKNGLKTEITDDVSMTNAQFEIEKIKYQVNKYLEPGAIELKSDPIKKLTSSSLKELWSLIQFSEERLSEVKKLYADSKEKIDFLSKTILRLNKSLFRFLFKKRIGRLQVEYDEEMKRFSEFEQQMGLTKIELKIDSEDEFNKCFDLVIRSFKLLSTSLKKWDFTTARSINQIAERTHAATSITRSEIETSEKTLPVLQSKLLPLCMHNMNGGDIYFYPGFLIIYEDAKSFALIDYCDLSIHGNLIKFHERDNVPSDSNTVGYTWHKVNKDGTPDRRFSSNYKIPIVEYYEIKFTSITGLNEVYCFSNVEYGQIFYKSFSGYIESLKKAKQIIDSIN